MSPLRSGFRRPHIVFARCRIGILASFLAVDLLLRLLALPAANDITAIVLAWLAASAFWLFALNRARDEPETNIVGSAALLLDTLLMALLYLRADGGWWMGATFFGYIVLAAIVTLPPRPAAIIVGITVLAFDAVLLAPVLRPLRATPYLSPSPLDAAAHVRLLLAILTTAALIGMAAFQSAFVRVLRRSEERMRLLMNSASDIIVTLDREGRYLSLNDTAVTLLGTREELIGKSLGGFVIPEDAQAMADAFAEVVAGRPRSIDCRLRVRDGSLRWISAKGTPIIEGGVVVGVLAICGDITESRSAAERLRASELRKAAVLESAFDCIITVDEFGRITGFNASAERTFGFLRVEMIGRDMAEMLVPRALRSQFRATLSRCLEGLGGDLLGKPTETLALRADGREFPVEMTVSMLQAERPALFTFFLRDITEQKRAASERDRLQAELAQSQKMQAVGQLVSGIGHELNNPLAAIMAFAEDMLADERDDCDREALGVISAQALRARSIVRDLLTFVRRNEVDERTSVMPGELMRAVAQTFQPQLVHAGVILRVDVPELPALVVSRAGLEQVLTNILANALLACPQGGEVRMSARRVNGRCELIVEDSGTGIPQEVMPRLFEPFFTTRPPGQGTGLGLAVAHGIVEQHQGRIWAENRVEGGARLTVSLPIAGALRDADATSSSGGASVTTNGGHHDGNGHHADARRRVLVIDDERTIRVALRRYFERRGWELDEAEDGRAGYERLAGAAATRPYDVIICDLKMPGMTGIELHQKLAAERPDLLERLLFSTGDTASVDAAAFLERTSCPVLEKPFELLALATAVDRLCAGERPAKRSRAAVSSN